MKTWKTIMKIIFGLLVTVCIFSFAKFLYLTELLDIQKIVLREGTFEVIDVDNEFEFGKLKNKPFNIVVRFYKNGGINYSSLFSASGLVSGKVPYAISIDLRDHNNDVLKKEIKQNSFMPAGGYTNEYFDWKLLQFDAKRGEKYKVNIIFRSDFKDFDKMRKELYVEQDYDSPSAVWWLVLQRVYLIVFIVTFVSSLIISLLFWRQNKWKGK